MKIEIESLSCHILLDMCMEYISQLDTKAQVNGIVNTESVQLGALKPIL